MVVEKPLNNVVFTVVQYNLCYVGVIVPKISFFGMIFVPFWVVERGGIAIWL